MNSWIQFVGLIVIPIVALVGLFYYVRATIEQAEAMQKPCVVLYSAIRNREEAILAMHGIHGDLMLGQLEGLVSLENVGSGPAINVAYVFEKVGEPENVPIRSEGSIPTLPSQAKLKTHASYGIFPAHTFDCTIIYESLGKRRYETHVFINDVVLGEFKFQRFWWWPRLTRWVSKRRRQRKAQRFESVA